MDNFGPGGPQMCSYYSWAKFSTFFVYEKKYIKLFKKEKRNQLDGLEAAENHSLAFSLRASHQGDVK